MRVAPSRPSSISATARSLIDPLPVRRASRMPWRPRMRAPVGKSGPLDELHQVVRCGLGVLEQVDGGVDDLAQVVGRDVGGHPDGDALRSVDQHVGEARRQDRRLLGGGVVVGGEVDRLLVDAAHQFEGQGAQPALGVAHGRRALVRSGAPEVAVAVDQRMAHRELLDHAGQRLVDGRVAVGVVRAHDVADHLGALGVGSVGQQPLVVHRVEDPAVDRLQPVPHVGQGPRHDDRHRVLEEGALHLLLDLDGLDEPRHVLVGVGPPTVVVTSWHALSFSVSLVSTRPATPPAAGSLGVLDLRCRGSARPWRWSG